MGLDSLLSTSLYQKHPGSKAHFTKWCRLSVEFAYIISIHRTSCKVQHSNIFPNTQAHIQWLQWSDWCRKEQNMTLFCKQMKMTRSRAFSAARLPLLQEQCISHNPSPLQHPRFQSSDSNTAVEIQPTTSVLTPFQSTASMADTAWEQLIKRPFHYSGWFLEFLTKTLSVMDKISDSAWHKPRLPFQLIPEDKVNSNLCLNTANTSKRWKKSSPPPVISLKSRWRQSVYGASRQYQLHRDCATAGNATEPLVYFKIHYKSQNRHQIFFPVGSKQWKMGISVAYTD